MTAQHQSQQFPRRVLQSSLNNTMKYMFRRFIEDENGGPAIEFAMVASLIAICLPAMIDMATLINEKMKISGGMRAGEQYALKYPTDSTGIAQAIASASNLSSSSITVTTSEFCECSGVSNICSSSCSYGVQLAKYLTITVNYDISSLYNYSVPFYPQSISKTMMVRTQ